MQMNEQVGRGHRLKPKLFCSRCCRWCCCCIGQMAKQWAQAFWGEFVADPFLFHILMESPHNKNIKQRTDIIRRYTSTLYHELCSHCLNLIAIAMRVSEHQTASRLELFSKMDVSDTRIHSHIHTKRTSAFEFIWFAHDGCKAIEAIHEAMLRQA